MKGNIVHASVATRLVAALALPGLLACLYLFAIRPSQLRWGATALEVSRSMPGDDLVHSPSLCATRAITIDRRSEEIWSWLAQMGYGRAGFYGYDLIENIGSDTGMRSVESILPQFQHPKPGDALPISAVASMVFGSIQPGSYLVWRGGTTPSDGSIVWALYPVDNRHTRLVSRIRFHYHWTKPPLLFLDLFTEFGDHVAVAKILLGIKARVEKRPSEPLLDEAAEIMVCVLALAELIAAMLFIFRWHRWGRAWFLAFTSGLLLLFVLYVRAPTWIGAASGCGIFAGMILSLRAGSGSSPEG